MYYRIRPPDKFYGTSLKRWYRRLSGPTLPVNWRDRPALWVKERHLGSVMLALHHPTGVLSIPHMSLRTYRT